MNEEELNVKEEKMFLYQILEEHVDNDKKHFNPCQESIRLGLQKGFQKGKLEQKKEEFAFLNGVLKLPEVWALVIAKRLKQLQKEINSQTENEVLIAENSISDKEVAQPYSKSDTTTKGFILSDGQFQKEVDFAKKEIGGTE